MIRRACLVAVLVSLGCSQTIGDISGDDAGSTSSSASFAGNWVAKPYHWNVSCSNPTGTKQGGSDAVTDGISKLRIEVSGTKLRMFITDQAVGCVQDFSIDAEKATHVGDEGKCSFAVDGANGMGQRTIQSDDLVLSADGSTFSETVKYADLYSGDYTCTGNDSATWYRMP